ncbi:hypothetical protein FRB95_004596 [Tulasnella sp. JGI-2019a]|nr:hypothetical protein FRB95_004596 [Tulasnella sp. JGI-2019a]
MCSPGCKTLISLGQKGINSSDSGEQFESPSGSQSSMPEVLTSSATKSSPQTRVSSSRVQSVRSNRNKRGSEDEIHSGESGADDQFKKRQRTRVIPDGSGDMKRSSGRHKGKIAVTDYPSSQRSKRASRSSTILFYEITEPYYGFTNFSPHEVEFKGKVYPTSEHLFQSLKFLEHKPLLAEHIRTAGKQPRVALSEAHRFAPEARKDWFDVNIAMMDLVILHKFEQHDELRKELLSTGDADLVEDAGANDAFWGNGADGKGRNELGKALMRLRDHFRKESS